MPPKPLTRAGLIYGMIYDIREVEVELAEIFGHKPDALPHQTYYDKQQRVYHIPISTYIGGMIRYMGYPLNDDKFTNSDRHSFDEYLSQIRGTDLGAMMFQRHCDEVFEMMHRFNLSTGYNGQEFEIGMTVLRDAVTVTYRLED